MPTDSLATPSGPSLPQSASEWLNWLQAEPLHFQSVGFALFVGIVLLLFNVARANGTARAGILALASAFFFYKIAGLWVLLPLATGLLDYFLGMAMPNVKPGRQRNALVAVSLVSNLGTLLYFKYSLFFGGLAYDICRQWNPGCPELTPGTWTLPGVGLLAGLSLSYYTLRSLSYVMDLAREELDEPELDPLRYLSYVLFFGNIQAGPITRAGDFLPALHGPYTLTADMRSRAFYWFMLGLGKKLIVADFLAVNYVNRMFDTPESYTGFELLMAALAYLLQLYFDFSGYSHMALALALILGIALPANFNQPLKSTSISEFWRRWHLSLSSWFNDYVYTPLVFRWRGLKKFGAALAALITFVLSGLWHGPNLTFVVWGALHGLAIAYEVVSQPLRRKVATALPFWVYRPFSIGFTLVFLALSFLLARAKDLDTALLIYQRMLFHFAPEVAEQWLSAYLQPAVMMLSALLVCWLPTAWKEEVYKLWQRMPLPLQAVAWVLGFLLAYQFVTSELQPFIYLKY